MDDLLDKLIKQVESLALDIIMLDSQDIPGLGSALKYIETMETLSKEFKEESIASLVKAMKAYVEKVILGEKTELSPVEKAVTKLQEICRDIANGRQPQKNISPILSELGYETKAGQEIISTDDEEIEIDIEDIEGEEKKEAGKEKKDKGEEKTPSAIDEDDREIIADFVAESLENLSTIEIKLVDLEQDPGDTDTINDIFRPFHTVKGVSGFLNFNKINTLSHTAENLLDKARNGQITIEGETVDLVLETVDALKQMIESIQASLNSGKPSEGDMDTTQIISKIEHILSQAELGGNKQLGEILVEKGTISQDDLTGALETQKSGQEKKIGEILVEQDKSAPKDVLYALREQKKSARQFVDIKTKVDTGKLDNIVDMVGELAIAQSMLRQHDNIKTSTNRELDQIINQLNLIISGLQKTAMSLRMVPIKNTFQKMLRLVRDLSKKAEKEVQLVMSGEDTEIDRNMVEEIYEPMVHMVRNSIDHGLESLEERSLAKKPDHGTIHVKAYHKGGDFVIEISDDGRGLHRDKILKKAVSKGLIKENEKLSDGEINNLIFKPGFSTAEKITDISGRGVGMDVVKNIIVDKLRGRVEVQSSEGEGTTFFIRLPLTLAIVDGMIVKIGEEKYILPTLSIQESFRPKKSDCHTVKGKGEVVMFRNNLIPLIRLNSLFVGNGDKHVLDTQPWEKLVVVVENQGRTKCILVDELLGQEEVVIKSLGETLKDLKGIAGGAILGDGRVGLILDIAGIFDIASGDQ